jgi:CheY-like chemotaxis protein
MALKLASSIDNVQPEEEMTPTPVLERVRRVSGVQRIELPPTFARPTYWGPQPHAKSILVVDDDDSVRELISRTLAERYTIYEAKDGVFALQTMREMEHPPNAVVCDISMPRLDGLELARHLKLDPRTRHVAIVFVTARIGALDVIEGINAGARHYVTKPFKMAELIDKVSRVVR